MYRPQLLPYLRGLIDQVGNADQLAGVMAHETGHIARRDPLVALFRGAGIGMISATLGINFGFVDLSSLAGRLVGSSYSRDMERVADANGVAYLQASEWRSDGLAGFFALIDKQRRHRRRYRISVGPSENDRSSKAEPGIAAWRQRADGAAMGGSSNDVR